MEEIANNYLINSCYFHHLIIYYHSTELVAIIGGMEDIIGDIRVVKNE